MLFGGYTLEVPEAIPHVKWGLHLRPIREGNAKRPTLKANQRRGGVWGMFVLSEVLSPVLGFLFHSIFLLFTQ